MSIDFFKRLATFTVLLLVQGLVFNNIHLFNSATPMMHVIFVLHFRRNFPRWAVLMWSFMLGLCVDVFANTPGVAAASMTAVAFIQPYFLELFLSRDSADDLMPSMHTLGVASYFWYAFVLVLIYCLLFFTLETFNFFNWQQWLACIGGSFALSLVLIMAIENFRK